MKCCLIGKTLKHSYSKIIHDCFNEYSYELVELKEEQVKDFAQKKEYDAFNGTIPYKEKIMEFLDVIDPFAIEIGAVNTVVNKNGKLYGYNTDFFGVEYMLNSIGLDVNNKNIMILGSGGTSKTVRSVCKHLKAKSVIVVSRTGEINYQNCYNFPVDIIINTTPVGMYPNSYITPIDLDKFVNLEGVVDVIYNPQTTLICQHAKEGNIKNVNGLTMLVAQAKRARDLFLDNVGDDALIQNTVKKIIKSTQNLYLIGMAGSGKTTIGKELSRFAGKEFYDTDEEIIRRLNLTIPEIFEKYGEEHFRKVESEVLKELSNKRGVIIATGGGIVVNEENFYPIKLNGVAIWIKRDVNCLDLSGRPLSKDKQTVKNLYLQRIPLYAKFADFEVYNNTVSNAVKEIIDL